MSDPPRLSRHPKGGLAAKLIDSARDDDPPRTARQRALLAIGTSGGAILAAGAAKGAALSAGAIGTAGAVGTAAGGSTAPAGTTTGALLAWGALAKWVGGGAVVAVVTAGAMTKMSAPASMIHRPSAAVATHGASPTAVRVPPPREPRVPDPAPIASPPPEVEPPRAEPERTHAAPSKLPARESNGEANDATARRAAPDLVGEIAALDRAREALATGAPERALAALDEYDRRFSGGTLTIESKVLRIESVAQKGDREKAGRLAETFLAQHPSSAHASRVRSLLLSVRKDRTP